MTQKWRARGVRATRAMAPGIMAVGLLSAMALGGASGCDTVARLSFSDRVFNDVRVVGFTPEGGACTGSDGAAVIRFVLADGDGNPIDNETVIGSSTVTLTRDDVAIEDVTFYELPDVTCAEMGDCGPGMACEETPNGPNACQSGGRSINVDGAPRFVAEITRPQAFGVLVENSASMQGRLPTAIRELAPDYRGEDGPGEDGRGDATGDNYTLFNSERATDPNRARVTAVSNLVQTWTTVFTRASTDNQVRSAFGLWSFGRERSEVLSMAPSEAQWVYSEQGARAAVDELGEVARRQSNTSAGVYRSMLAVLQDEERFGVFGPQDEKILAVIVDGPDELRGEEDTVAAVIAAAEAANVRVFMVHLDPEVQVRTGSGIPLIPDVTTYFEQQDDAPCTDSSECKAFEACRPITRYSAMPNSNVTQPTGKLMGSYCAIEYEFSDADQTRGRIGPISEYAEIACATGGGYLYFPSTAKLSDGDGAVAKLPLALDGLWEVDVNASPLSDEIYEGGEPYKVGMIFSATVDNTQKRQNMTDDLFEVRPVIFSAE